MQHYQDIFIWTQTLHIKMKFSIKDFSIKCDQICIFMRIWSYIYMRNP